jgi:N utilization substance protein A
VKSDFYTAIAQIAAERGIPKEAVLSSGRARARHRLPQDGQHRRGRQVEIEPTSGEMRVWVLKRVVDEIEDPLNDITPAEALAYTP